MNSKIYSILLVALLVLSTLPMAFAEDTTGVTFTAASEDTSGTTETTTVTTEDEKQVKDLEVPAGAELRFLQLQRAVMKNIFTGEQTIAVLTKNYPEKDLTALTQVLDDMKALLENVKTTTFDNKDPKQIATEFVGFKKTSIDLTKQFREESKKLITKEDIKQIKDAIKANKDEIKAIDDQIKTARRELNAKRAEAILAKMGTENPELVQKIKDGTATKEDVKNALKEAVKTLVKEKKVEFVKQLKSDVVQRAAEREKVKEDIKNEIEKYKEELKVKIKEHQKGGDNNE